MSGRILRVLSAELIGPHALALRFNDGTRRRVDLFPVLTGPIFRPLRNPEYFARVVFDPVAGTVAWPNGADFAPEFLRELPKLSEGKPVARRSNPAVQRSARAAARR